MGISYEGVLRLSRRQEQRLYLFMKGECATRILSRTRQSDTIGLSIQTLAAVPPLWAKTGGTVAAATPLGRAGANLQPSASMLRAVGRGAL
jgi:hypothetical protein